MSPTFLRRTLLILLVIASGCAVWVVDRPGYQMKKLEWVHLIGDDAHRRLRNLCANDVVGQLACAFRIQGSGICLVYSIYSLEEAKRIYVVGGDTLYQHEVGDDKVPGHCGGGRPDGYTNHEGTP